MPKVGEPAALKRARRSRPEASPEPRERGDTWARYACTLLFRSTEGGSVIWVEVPSLAVVSRTSRTSDYLRTAEARVGIPWEDIENNRRNVQPRRGRSRSHEPRRRSGHARSATPSSRA